jgi:hypothetical protein
MSKKPTLKFVVSVYGQTGYVDTERFNNPKINLLPLLNELGEKIKVNEDQNEIIHRGNITNDYELFGDFILAYTKTHEVWEAYRRTNSFPATFITSSSTRESLRLKLVA